MARSVPLSRFTSRAGGGSAFFVRRLGRVAFFIIFMGWITDILKEVPLSAVLREKLATADSEIDTLKTENTNLRQLVKQQDGEIDRLKKEVASLQKPKTVPDVAWSSQPRIKGRMGL